MDTTRRGFLGGLLGTAVATTAAGLLVPKEALPEETWGRSMVTVQPKLDVASNIEEAVTLARARLLLDDIEDHRGFYPGIPGINADRPARPPKARLVNILEQTRKDSRGRSSAMGTLMSVEDARTTLNYLFERRIVPVAVDENGGAYPTITLPNMDPFRLTNGRGVVMDWRGAAWGADWKGQGNDP